MKLKEQERPLNKIIASPVFNKDNIYKFFYYVLNRHEIQMKKDKGSPYPWTTDTILSTNSFTCNRRIDDRTTKWLLENIINKDLQEAEQFWQILIFRLYNKIETAKILKLGTKDYWRSQEAITELSNQDGDVYTRAYKTVSIKYVDKDKYPGYDWRVLTLLRIKDLAAAYNYQVPREILVDVTNAFNWLCQIKGVGDFVGFQLLIDLMYLPWTPYSNNVFVVAGPGAQTGIERLFINKDKMSYEECIQYLTENFEELCREYYDNKFKYINIKRQLNDMQAYCITDVQNLLCEFSKYMYLLEDRHKNKRKYVPKMD